MSETATQIIAPEWTIEDDGDGLAVEFTAPGTKTVRIFFTLPDAETFADDLVTAATFNNAAMESD